jgi:hypothetical protein
LIRQIDKQLRRLPDWLRRYVIVLAAVTAGCGLGVLLLHTVGDKSKVVISLLGDLVFLGASCCLVSLHMSILDNLVY